MDEWSIIKENLTNNIIGSLRYTTSVCTTRCTKNLGGIYKRFLLKLPFANYRFFEKIAENTIGLNT